jgi:hypothetical protein
MCQTASRIPVPLMNLPRRTRALSFSRMRFREKLPHRPWPPTSGRLFYLVTTKASIAREDYALGRWRGPGLSAHRDTCCTDLSIDSFTPLLHYPAAIGYPFRCAISSKLPLLSNKLPLPTCVFLGNPCLCMASIIEAKKSKSGTEPGAGGLENQNVRDASTDTSQTYPTPTHCLTHFCGCCRTHFCDTWCCSRSARLEEVKFAHSTSAPRSHFCVARR